MESFMSIKQGKTWQKKKCRLYEICGFTFSLNSRAGKKKGCFCAKNDIFKYSKKLMFVHSPPNMLRGEIIFFTSKYVSFVNVYFCEFIYLATCENNLGKSHDFMKCMLLLFLRKHIFYKTFKYTQEIYMFYVSRSFYSEKFSDVYGNTH